MIGRTRNRVMSPVVLPKHVMVGQMSACERCGSLMRNGKHANNMLNLVKSCRIYMETIVYKSRLSDKSRAFLVKVWRQRWREVQEAMECVTGKRIWW